MSNAIITENQNAGTGAWKIGTGASTQIQVYADRVSLDPGQTINFYVSTQTASAAYTIAVYRLGYYGGLGGCLKYTASNTGIQQGSWDDVGKTFVVSCPTLIYNSTTHLTEAGWTITDSYTVPGGACTGIYAAIFTTGGVQGGVTFIVRSPNSTSDYVYVRSCATEAAYNEWGGYSVYTTPLATKTSFNRPNTYNCGLHNVYFTEINAIQWFEQQGYDIAYISDIDMQVTPTLLLAHKVYLCVGHAEYWTYEMRGAVEAAIAAGVSAAFLGGNDCYWQIRLEADAGSNANRTVVCYKVGSFTGLALSTDPEYGVDNTRVTTRWRDAPLNRPEASMIGIQFSALNQATNYAWTVDPSPDAKYLAGTGLVASSSYGTDCVGNEWDNIQTGSPGNIKTIATTNVTMDVSLGGGSDTSKTTYYIAPSGAMVFASGSIEWVWSLGSYRWTGLPVNPVPQMRLLLRNIMGGLKGPVYGNLGGH